LAASVAARLLFITLESPKDDQASITGTQVAVTLITPDIDAAVSHGVLHRTKRFVGVGAVGKAAKT
jgi:hypothetical protein